MEKAGCCTLGISKIDKVAKNNMQSLKNSVLTCITYFIAPIINKSTRETNYVAKPRKTKPRAVKTL